MKVTVISLELHQVSWSMLGFYMSLTVCNLKIWGVPSRSREQINSDLS